MKPVEMSLVVVRTHRLAAVRAFYEALGLGFVSERHGSGPAHVSATLPSGLVFELYPAVAGDAIERGGVGDVRLGFVVRDVEAVVAVASQHGGTVISDVADRGNGASAVVADPDGRRVEITSTAT